MENSGQNTLQKIYNKKIDAAERISCAAEALQNSSLSPEFILKWVSNNFTYDKASFQTNGDAWKLFLDCIIASKSEGTPFLLNLRPNLVVLSAFKSDIRDIALEALSMMCQKFPNAWRPKLKDLFVTLTSLLELETIYKDQIMFIIKVISSHRDLTVASESIFKDIVELFDPLINNAEFLDSEQVLIFLSNALCGPFLFQKINGKEIGNIFDPFIKKLVEPSKDGKPIRDMVCNFMHTFLPIYNDCCTVPNKFAFPLGLYKRSQSLDLAVPIINESRKLKFYTPQTAQEGDFEALNFLTERAIKENHQLLLTELTRIDFRLVRPTLSILLETADEDFAIACLEMAFELRMPQVILGQDELPRNEWDGSYEIDTRLDPHIVEFPRFVKRYSELVSVLNFEQTNGLLRILASARKDSDQALLFWTAKSANFTSLHIDVVEYILKTCGTNPWRCAAASIACHELRLKTAPVITEEMYDSHPIILYTLLSLPRFGQAEEVDEVEVVHWKKVPRSYIVPSIPTPQMEAPNVFKLAFIISHLPEMTHCFHDESLERIVRYVLIRAPSAESLEEPKTISDYSLRLLANTHFFESERLRKAFHSAALSILKGEARDAKDMSENDRNTIAMIISAMPTEFLQTPQESLDQGGEALSIVAYNILINYIDSEFEVGDLFKEASQHVTDMIINLATALPSEFVKENIDSLFRKVPNEIVTKLLPILMFRSQSWITDMTDLTKEAILGLCEYSFQTGTPLPYTDLYYGDDMDCLCAQVKVGLESAITYILSNVMFNHKNAIQVMDALSYVTEIEKKSKALKKKVGMLVKAIVESHVSLNKEEKQKEENVMSVTTVPPLKMVLSNFVSALPKVDSDYYQVTSSDYVIELVKNATPEMQIAIFNGVVVDDTTFQVYEEYFVNLVTNDLSLDSLKSFSRLRIARFFSESILECVFIHITTYLNQCSSLDEVTILCQCITNVFSNSRRASRVPVLALESVRHASSQYFNFMQTTEPSFKQLKVLSKMYATVSRSMRSDFQHYLIASFVSKLCSIQKFSTWSTTKQKMLQNCIFPLFQKVEKEKLNEISIALHETHRQQFQILYQRWEKEAAFTGKV